jgi:holo-[acyl-carrier protein] synthase
MLAGLGTDLIEVERIAQKLNKGSDFRELVFSKVENCLRESKINEYPHYEAWFAAKEAFF